MSERLPIHQDILSLFLPGSTSSSWTCYSHIGPWTKLEHTPNMWRGVKRWPRTSSTLATSLGGQRGRPTQVGGLIGFDFVSVSDSTTARTKTDAQVSYGVGFRRTWYGWKDNFKTLPMELVSVPNSSGVDRNRRNKMASRICLGVASQFFGLWAMYRVEPIRGATRGGLVWPKPFISCCCHHC